MEKQTLEVEVRELSGKGPARQLRMQGKIPAVFYGPGVETTKVSVSPKELLHALETPFKRNVVITANVAGTAHDVMIKDIAVHPVTRAPLHVDLYKVDDSRAVEVHVPVTTTGKPIGVQKGGRLQLVFRDLPIKAAPSKIPAKIDIDVSEVDIGQIVTVADLDLPEGVAVQFKPDRRVVLVTEARVEIEVEEEAAGEDAAAPADAAPAAT